MTRKIVRTSLNENEQKAYNLLSERLGISNESDLIKKAIMIANTYCDQLEKDVPQEVFQAYLDKLRYTRTLKTKKQEKGKIWSAPAEDA